MLHQPPAMEQTILAAAAVVVAQMRVLEALVELA
jgi:hypothetical protein